MAGEMTGLAAVPLSRRVLTAALGRGALARPRPALVRALALIAIGLLGWALVAQPWRGVSLGPGAGAVSSADVGQALTRSGVGPGGSEIQVVWTTPEYFRWTNQPGLADRYGTSDHLVFFLWENLHDGELPERLLPAVRVDGQAYLPERVHVPADAVHHRFSVFIYPDRDEQGRMLVGRDAASVEMVLPPANADGAQSVLSWPVATEPALTGEAATVQITGASILALLGGVLASMWPCLFQLTAYFIPALAGFSVSEARERQDRLVVRARVARTAGLFVLGFVIVYTAAGAGAGFAAQSLGGQSFFWSLRRPLSVGAGVMMLLMAARMAANARAPLVCKMPVIGQLGRRQPGPLATMALGVAFAAGCTTCFGAALVLGMVTYLGIAGTPLIGALVMFLFALGMAIPLMAGALAMARVLTMIGKMERLARGMVLASSVVMAGFAALLLSGRFMGLGNVLARGGP